METMKGLHRTHGCGTISEAEVGKEVVLCGWVERRRDHGGLIFLDLRDRSGIVQVVASPDHNVESFHKAEDVRNEYEPVSYTHHRAHQNLRHLVCRLVL